MLNIALVMPSWQLAAEGTAHYSCTESHTPLPFLYALTLLEARETASGFLVDGHLLGLSHQELAQSVAAQTPDIIVMATAPGYGSWKTPPVDLKVPAQLIATLRAILPEVPILLCGPHGSSNPDEVLDILDCDGVIRGEPEEVIADLTPEWQSNSHIFQRGKHPWNVERGVVVMENLPPINFQHYPLLMSRHQHRFLGPLEQDINPEQAVSVDVEWSRGCQYSCTFCNRQDFRSKYRERSIGSMMAELKALKAQGISYVNFIDDLFGLGKTPDLLVEMRQQDVPAFGIQTRIDLWDEKSIDFLQAAGCRHIEFGLESPLTSIQKLFNREYKYTLKRTEEVILHAVSKIQSVVVTLMEAANMTSAQLGDVSVWRESMLGKGCWVTEPVKTYPYPSTHYYKQTVAAEPITARGDWDKAYKVHTGVKVPLLP